MDAQPHFIRGMLLLHSFEYDDAADAFREAQQVDQDFAMAYWGEALTYTHLLWDSQNAAAGRAVLARLGASPEARATKAPTEREKRYLGAVEVRLGRRARRASRRRRRAGGAASRPPTLRESRQPLELEGGDGDTVAVR